MEKGVFVEGQDGVQVITFSNPSRGNALDAELLQGIRDALSGFDPMEARCIVLRGAGEKRFSTGFDVTTLPIGAGDEAWFEFTRVNPLKETCDAILAYPFPVIAMLNGSLAGGSVEMAMSCDIRVAREGIQVMMPPCRLGLIYSFQGLQKFIQLAGHAKAREIFYTAEPVGVDEAEKIGLVNKVVPGDQLEGTCMAMAQRIASNAPLSVRGHKHVLNALTDRMPLEPEQFQKVMQLTFEAFNSEDLKEGVTAFLENREPRFQGK